MCVKSKSYGVFENRRLDQNFKISFILEDYTRDFLKVDFITLYRKRNKRKVKKKKPDSPRHTYKAIVQSSHTHTHKIWIKLLSLKLGNLSADFSDPRAFLIQCIFCTYQRERLPTENISAFLKTPVREILMVLSSQSLDI